MPTSLVKLCSTVFVSKLVSALVSLSTRAPFVLHRKYRIKNVFYIVVLKHKTWFFSTKKTFAIKHVHICARTWWCHVWSHHFWRQAKTLQLPTCPWLHYSTFWQHQNPWFTLCNTSFLIVIFLWSIRLIFTTFLPLITSKNVSLMTWPRLLQLPSSSLALTTPTHSEPQLYWLLVHSGIHFELATITYKAFSANSRQYLSSFIHHPIHSLCSSDRHYLLPTPSSTNFGSRSFRYSTPTICYLIPLEICSSQAIDTSKHIVK